VMVAIISCQPKQEPKVLPTSDYASLVMLFKEWRTFENPPLLNGAPDYSATSFAQRLPQFKNLQAKLQAIDTAKWSVPNRIDWMLVWAEMNGFDFNNRVLQPWVRDPAFYKVIWTERSDVPAHEGPTNHGIIELWTYTFPLTPEALAKLTKQLQSVKPFLCPGTTEPDWQRQRTLVSGHP
jgi:alpha-N-acetylglucosamine transferase